VSIITCRASRHIKQHAVPHEVSPLLRFRYPLTIFENHNPDITGLPYLRWQSVHIMNNLNSRSRESRDRFFSNDVGLRIIVRNKVRHQHISRINDEASGIVDFAAAYSEFHYTPDAEAQLGPHPEQDIAKRKAELAEARAEMQRDLAEIEQISVAKLIQRMRWAEMEDQLERQMPHPTTDPGWWLERSGEIDCGRFLLSDMAIGPNFGAGLQGPDALGLE